MHRPWWCRGARRGAHPDAGQATVELALMLPMVVLLLMAVFQVALVARDQVLAVQAARAAAREAPVDAGTGRIQGAVRDVLPGADVQVGKRGRIGVITSVAGERGRPRNYTYGAAKGALTVYLQGLRSRLYAANVSVTTIKLGPVDTPMTKGMDKLPLLVSPDAAAAELLAGAARGAHTVYVPAKWRPIMFVIRHIPSFVFRRLDI